MDVCKRLTLSPYLLYKRSRHAPIVNRASSLPLFSNTLAEGPFFIRYVSLTHPILPLFFLVFGVVGLGGGG